MSKFINKRNIIILCSVIVIIIGLIICLCFKKEKVNEVKSINQTFTIEGLEFSNSSVYFDSGVFNFNSTVKNIKKSKQNISTVEIIFLDKDNNEIGKVNGYIGKELSTDEDIAINAATDVDIRNYDHINVIINN